MIQLVRISCQTTKKLVRTVNILKVEHFGVHVVHAV